MVVPLPPTEGLLPTYSFHVKRAAVCAIPYDLSIELDRSKGDKVGASIVTDEDGTVLTITAVTGGLLEAWNAANPDKQVSANDSIVQVNGIHSDSELMRAEIKLAQKMEVKIVRWE